MTLAQTWQQRALEALAELRAAPEPAKEPAPDVYWLGRELNKWGISPAEITDVGGFSVVARSGPYRFMATRAFLGEPRLEARWVCDCGASQPAWHVIASIVQLGHVVEDYEQHRAEMCWGPS